MRAMSKRLRTLTITLSVVASVLAGAWSPAGAGGISRSDGNDVPGPLDLASMRLTPISGGDRIQIRTLGKFTATQLDGDAGWFEVDFDTNADRKYDFWAVVFYAKGKLFAIQGQGQNALRKMPVRRVDTRTVSFDIAHRNLGNISSYDFVVYSIWRAKPCSNANPCVDTIPNRYPLIRHDFTAPTISWGAVPEISIDVSATLDFDVHATVHDDTYGSGVKRWTLQQRQNAGSWTTIASGRTKSVTESVTGVQGEVTIVRVLAVDKQGNRRTSSTKKTVVPWDDQNALFFDYSTPGTEASAVSGAFLGTTSTLAQGTIVTATLPAGSDLCFLGGPTSSGNTAAAELSIGGTPFTTFNENDATAYRTPHCAGTTIGAGAVITLEVTSAEPFVFDGLVLKR
jgi:hypothetical protein